MIGDVWVVWVVDNRMCDATDLGANGSRLAGVSAGTGEVVWSLDADSKWSCDTLPSAPKIICTDLAGTIFTLDEAGTRSDLITFPGRARARTAVQRNRDEWPPGPTGWSS